MRPATVADRLKGVAKHVEVDRWLKAVGKAAKPLGYVLGAAEVVRADNKVREAGKQVISGGVGTATGIGAGLAVAATGVGLPLGILIVAASAAGASVGVEELYDMIVPEDFSQ